MAKKADSGTAHRASLANLLGMAVLFGLAAGLLEAIGMLAFQTGPLQRSAPTAILSVSPVVSVGLFATAGRRRRGV